MEDNKNIEVKETIKVKKQLWKKIVKGLLIFSAIMLISATVVLGYVSFKYGDRIKATIKDGNTVAQTINKTAFNSRKPTQFYDSDGKLLKEFNTNTYYYTKVDDLNPYVADAVTSIEDERFYEHHGIDYKGIRRSVWVYVKSKGSTLQGGSTITQQLARNVFLTFDVTLWRKLEEAVIAQKLEERYSKSEILEFYVNNVNYGNGCYSVESAAQYYFQKSNTDLDLSQIAMLAAIPNNPSFYNPTYNLDNTIKRRNLVLSKMLSLGKISQNDYDIAKAEVIKLNIKKSVKSEPIDYSVQYAVHNATLKLMEQDGFVLKYNFTNDTNRKTYFKKYNAEYAIKEKQLLAGRYRIDTSIDSAKQEKLQVIVDNQLQKYTDTNNATGLYKKQGASVTIDNTTGEVVAIVGGRSQYGNTFNRGFLSVRQPGSAIKPLVAYTPAFERGYIPESEYEDKEIEVLSNGKTVHINNDDFKNRGQVSLRYALEISINTVAYRLVGETGVQKSLNYLRNMQFKYITPQDTNPIIAIGGFTKGVTPVEMASGYSTLSRNGTFITPTNIRKITNTVINEVLFENKHAQTKVYDSGASYLMTDALKGVLTNSHSTGSGLSLSNYPYAAGKTGTTDKSKDCWFVGYTPYYTTSVWVGNDIPAPQNMFGANEPGRIWKEYMQYLHKNLEQKDFTRPNTVVTNRGILMNTLFVKLNPNGKIAKTEKEKLKEQADKNARAAAKQKVIDDAKNASNAAAKKVIDDAALKASADAATQKTIDDAAKQKAIDDAAKQKAIDDAAKQKAIDDAAAAAAAAAAQKAIDDANASKTN
ncbi:transglycosylase domain-containing protein [Clostridium lacusfryxellense]|uniref:transglycosylase domain-containing protein n=1 Tax=Clostridium lacusfryxellense TaxID=205328 RepID=UPI001C0D790E|nr:transglycosylase domain-containing protein [Clostridium lacusfryxellense]MBU3111661.1 penicillin-binding protein [Clostridium lacusfryxellense]